MGGHAAQQLGKGLGEQEADRRGLVGRERAAFVNSYQQGLATVGGVVGGAVAGGGTAVAAAQGGGVGLSVDVIIGSCIRTRTRARMKRSGSAQTSHPRMPLRIRA